MPRPTAARGVLGWKTAPATAGRGARRSGETSDRGELEKETNRRRVCSKKEEGVKRVFHTPNTRERIKKEGKYIQWQYNQVVDVWSPIFKKIMFGMANMQSVLFEVPFL